VIRVLGIDPGFGRLGLAIVDGGPGHLKLVHHECVETLATQEHSSRLLTLVERIEVVIKEFKPEVAAIEELFFAVNEKTVMRVSEARGVILYALAKHKVATAEYSPPEIKVALTGNGNAGKDQVARLVTQILGKFTGPDDVSDACAIAICHHHRQPLQSAMAKMQALRTGAA
jgi:crossover junction endodeoxyribonuclease RuvC